MSLKQHAFTWVFQQTNHVKESINGIIIYTRILPKGFIYEKIMYGFVQHYTYFEIPLHIQVLDLGDWS